MNGYTGTRKYEPVGVVHRGEFQGPCSCGGYVKAYSDGEVIAHSLPLDTKIEHKSTFSPEFPALLFDYKLVE